MTLTAQISVYPLRQDDLSPAIDAAVDAFRRHSLWVDYGPMSTIVSGEPHELFTALQEAFEAAAQAGHVVMTLTISNACPVPES